MFVKIQFISPKKEIILKIIHSLTLSLEPTPLEQRFLLWFLYSTFDTKKNANGVTKRFNDYLLRLTGVSLKLVAEKIIENRRITFSCCYSKKKPLLLLIRLVKSKPLNVTTLGQGESDNINQVITISDHYL